ncbi:MAG: hypothetical protein JNM55_09500 [Anaerolineales bacterium]|nr:hypothetical protein [Anaerolineales bacterium]
MNKTLSTTLTVLVVLALAAVIFFAGSMYARANAFGPSVMFGWNNNNSYDPGGMMGNGRGPSMMGGYANNNANVYGPGGMMGNGGNMMNGYSYNNANLTPLTVDQAKTAAEKYLANINNSDLHIAEVMIFDNNAYVVVKETSTGNGAFELLVDPTSQIAYPEHGPNMMWNLKYSGINHQYMMGGNGYGMMGGGMMTGYDNMMSGWNNTTPTDVSAEMTVTPEQAIAYAQQYLDANSSGATAATNPIQFYGYYTLDFEKDGKVTGMLSINGYRGQVFLHTWHGTFIEEAE